MLLLEASTSQVTREGLGRCERLLRADTLTPGLHVNAKVHAFEESLLSVVAKVNTCTQTTGSVVRTGL